MDVMRSLKTLVLVLFSLLPPTLAAAETATQADTTVVRALRESLGEYKRPVQAGDRIGGVLLKSPFQLIRRGAGAVSDLYSDGLKRHDINVTVDGERFTTACPNRMDTRVGQVDLLDIATVDMSRNSAVLQSGLGGQLDFRRRLPGQERRVYGLVSGAFDHVEDFDGSLAIEGRGLRLGGRYRQFQPYTDAEDRSFTDMYGYADAYTTRIFEVRGHAAHRHGDVVATYEGSEDLLFPYLLMDERTNDHYQLSGSYAGHRAYFNHTAHLMDNDLRTSAAMTDMVTDATNTMFGVVGEFYEVYARNWDADNHIIPLANPAMGKQNHMLPDVWRVGASLQHEVGDPSRPWLFLRAGVARTKVGDEDQLDLYRILEPEAELTKWSFPVGATATRLMDLSEDYLLGLSAEISSDAPGIEQQYIATDKPGTKPDWVGNPELSDPLRATARAALQRDRVQLEVFATRIWNYPYLARRSVEGAMYQTYTGVDALLAGANLFATWRWFDTGLSWNWGEKTEDSAPLSEIQPVTLYLKALSPQYEDFQGWALYQHAASQKRVDDGVDETSTGAWNRLDLGLDYERAGYRFSLSVENLTNVLYTQHLSYQRNPFASGLRVYEPGRMIRITVGFDL
jgi:iron complex outermembrane receptor protein